MTALLTLKCLHVVTCAFTWPSTMLLLLHFCSQMPTHSDPFRSVPLDHREVWQPSALKSRSHMMPQATEPSPPLSATEATCPLRPFRVQPRSHCPAPRPSCTNVPPHVCNSYRFSITVRGTLEGCPRVLFSNRNEQLLWTVTADGTVDTFLSHNYVESREQACGAFTHRYISPQYMDSDSVLVMAQVPLGESAYLVKFNLRTRTITKVALSPPCDVHHSVAYHHVTGEVAFLTHMGDYLPIIYCYNATTGNRTRVVDPRPGIKEVNHGPSEESWNWCHANTVHYTGPDIVVVNCAHLGFVEVDLISGRVLRGLTVRSEPQLPHQPGNHWNGHATLMHEVRNAPDSPNVFGFFDNMNSELVEVLWHQMEAIVVRRRPIAPSHIMGYIQYLPLGYVLVHSTTSFKTEVFDDSGASVWALETSGGVYSNWCLMWGSYRAVLTYTQPLLRVDHVSDCAIHVRVWNTLDTFLQEPGTISVSYISLSQPNSSRSTSLNASFHFKPKWRPTWLKLKFAQPPIKRGTITIVVAKQAQVAEAAVALDRPHVP